ncbi:putative transmembrane protein [Dirofilaria immitis]
MSNNSLTESTRLRIKEPVYTSDKRAKFTQQENKKWIRFCTIVGYIFFVSLPAASLSIYYIWIWNPDYISRFPLDKNRTVKIDHIAKPISSIKHNDQSRYRLDSFKRNNTSIKIRKSFFRTSVQSSLTTTTKQFLTQKPLKLSHKISQQQMKSSNIAD